MEIIILFTALVAVTGIFFAPTFFRQPAVIQANRTGAEIADAVGGLLIIAAVLIGLLAVLGIGTAIFLVFPELFVPFMALVVISLLIRLIF